MQLFLHRCYNTFIGVSIVMLTLVTWPLILFLQQLKFTREWYYSKIFGIICDLCNSVLVEPKVKLFDSMNEDLANLTKTQDIISVLEIGPGTGDNFKYYKSTVNLTTIDLNPFLEKSAQELSSKYPLIKIVDSRVANAEEMTCFDDNSFDIVLGTLIMCCINDNKAALSEIRRVLKLNGRYYFLEGNRMQSNRSPPIRLIQKCFAKFWITFEYGYKFMENNFDEKLKATKMVLQVHHIYRIWESVIGHELHYGCALKSE